MIFRGVVTNTSTSRIVSDHFSNVQASTSALPITCFARKPVTCQNSSLRTQIRTQSLMASFASSLASFASSLASSLASVASSASIFLNYPSATPTIKKEKNLDPYNKTNESVFQSTRRIDLVLRNYHQGHAEIEDANGSHGPFNESCSDRDLKRAFRLATMWRGHN